MRSDFEWGFRIQAVTKTDSDKNVMSGVEH